MNQKKTIHLDIDVPENLSADEVRDLIAPLLAAQTNELATMEILEAHEPN
jgi:hypothetical protein